MKITFFSNTQRDNWNNFLAKSNSNLFFFNRNFLDYNKSSVDRSLIISDINDNILALFLADVLNDDLYAYSKLPYGGLIIREGLKFAKINEILNEIFNFYKKKGFKKIIYKKIPNFLYKKANNYDSYYLFINNARIIGAAPTTTINLKKKINFSSLVKREINKYHKNITKVLNNGQLLVFYNLLKDILKKKYNKLPIHTFNDLILLKEKFNKNIIPIGSFLNKDFLGGMILFIFDNVVHTQYIAINDKGQSCGAHTSLTKYIIDNYSSTKDYLSFGISSNDYLGKSLNLGLLRKKESYGANLDLIYTYELKI